MKNAYLWDQGNLILSLRVQPRASRDHWVPEPVEGRFRVHITAPPVEGEANAHLCAFLAKLCRVPKSHVHLLSGENGREKRVQITAPRNVPPGVAFT